MIFTWASLPAASKERVAMEEITDDRWITRQELADRYGVPVKTPAEWASKGTGPLYAKFGRHVRYRMSDVVAWETTQMNQRRRNSA
jgi:excisionase family DNA binding protein